MNIGIDIDGVIFDSETYFRTFAEIYDIESGINSSIVNKEETRVQRRYDWTDEQFATYVRDVMVPLERNTPFMAGALKVLDELKKMGHRLVIISRRGSSGFYEEIEIANKRFAEVGLEFDGVYMDVGSKLDVCKQENIDVMIDDLDRTIDELSDNGIDCLYFICPDSREIKKDNVTSVTNWGEIYRYFVERQNN